MKPGKEYGRTNTDAGDCSPARGGKQLSKKAVQEGANNQVEYLQKLKILEDIRMKKLLALEELAKRNISCADIKKLNEKVASEQLSRNLVKTPKKLPENETLNQVKTAFKKKNATEVPDSSRLEQDNEELLNEVRKVRKVKAESNDRNASSELSFVEESSPSEKSV